VKAIRKKYVRYNAISNRVSSFSIYRTVAWAFLFLNSLNVDLTILFK